MQTKPLFINKGEYLDCALRRAGYTNIPSNVVLAKTLTGIGATHMEMKAGRNSIIIEPNVPVIVGKAEKADNSIAVYELCKPKQIKDFLKRKDLMYKKLLTTPEGFKKIKQTAQLLQIDIYKEYFCLFDECEKITQDVDYRPRISQPINDFFLFDNKAMVSATPLEMHHPELEQQKFTILKVMPTFDYKKDMTLIVTRSFDRTTKEQLRRLNASSKCVCVFFNSTTGINEVVNYMLGNHLIREDEYKVFCSKDSVRQLKECSFMNSYEVIDYPLAKFNFFTCRFFSAVDIISIAKPDILMLSDYKIPHSLLDPFTEVIQAQGRFRRTDPSESTFNSLTVVSNIDEEMEVMTDEEIERTIRQFEITHNSLMVRYSQADNDIDRKAIQKELGKENYRDLLDEEGNINYFSVDNCYNEERVRRYYTSATNLRDAYADTGHFNVNFMEETEGIGEDDKLAMRKASKKSLWKKVIKHLDRLNLIKCTYPDYDITPDLNILKEFEDADYIINAYNKIGKAGIESANYQKGMIDKMVKAYEEQQANKKRFIPAILREIQREFAPDIEQAEYIPVKSVRERLKVIFMAHGIPFKEYGKKGLEKVYFTLTDKTIEDYYSEFNVSNAKGGAYKLIAMKPELVEKIEEGI